MPPVLLASAARGVGKGLIAGALKFFVLRGALDLVTRVVDKAALLRFTYSTKQGTLPTKSPEPPIMNDASI